MKPAYVLQIFLQNKIYDKLAEKVIKQYEEWTSWFFRGGKDIWVYEDKPKYVINLFFNTGFALLRR